jgi:phospholipid:diacylglycerol acyltransferase
MDIPGHLAVFLEDYDISLSLPQIDVSRVQIEWKRLISTIPEPWKLNTDGREFQVGDAIKARGLEAKYPVVLIPGASSTVKSFFFFGFLVSRVAQGFLRAKG